jgi:CRP-like cAMP-binding protein
MRVVTDRDQRTRRDLVSDTSLQRTAETGATVAAAGVPAAPAADDHGLPQLQLPGRYRDTGLIGRGGMGAVRGVHDESLGRDVAAKMLDPSLAGHPARLQGFVEEARITAQLDHPNIVPVHELGSDAQGNIYFTMKRVHGRTLHELLGDPSLPLGSSERLSVGLEVFLKACDAVAFAHSRGVLHLDIKPANIMVGAFGEVYLMDWGIARVLRDRAAIVDVPNSTRLGADGLAGTPAFMAPEVANGQAHRIDERTDVFGLGALLSHLVTGRAPYTAATMKEVMERARACDPAPPEAGGDPFTPRTLARVIARAMAREPNDRHATVRELAAQVREFLHRGHHLPSVVHPAGTVIVREGDAGDHAYIITRGQCEAYRDVGGTRQVLRRMGPGVVFGEVAILGATTRTASVVALTEVTTLLLTRELLDEKLAPDSWEGLLAKTLIERFRELEVKLGEMQRDRSGDV